MRHLERDKALMSEAMDMQKEAFDAEMERMEQVPLWCGEPPQVLGPDLLWWLSPPSA